MRQIKRRTFRKEKTISNEAIKTAWRRKDEKETRRNTLEIKIVNAAKILWKIKGKGIIIYWLKKTAV